MSLVTILTRGNCKTHPTFMEMSNMKHGGDETLKTSPTYKTFGTYQTQRRKYITPKIRRKVEIVKKNENKNNINVREHIWRRKRMRTERIQTIFDKNSPIKYPSVIIPMGMVIYDLGAGKSCSEESLRLSPLQRVTSMSSDIRFERKGYTLLDEEGKKTTLWCAWKRDEPNIILLWENNTMNGISKSLVRKHFELHNDILLENRRDVEQETISQNIKDVIDSSNPDVAATILPMFERLRIDEKQDLDKKETLNDYLFISCEESVIDMYNAIDVQNEEQVLVVIYEGVDLPKINISSNKRIVWISIDLPMHCFEEVERWNKFSKSQQCIDLIQLFKRCRELVNLMSCRSDIVAIYPSTKVEVKEGENVVIGVFRVVVKAAGYIPIGEMPIPSSVMIDESEVNIEIQQGGIKWCGIKSGNSIAFEKDMSGYGTIGGVAISEEKYYAVTNEHVINGSFNNTRRGSLTDASYLCSPSKGWKKLQLLKHLKQPIFDVNGEFVVNVDSLLVECIPKIKSVKKVHEAMKTVSGGYTIHGNQDISLKQIVDFADYGQYRIGQSITRLNCDISTSNGIISGDVALIEIENAEQISTQCIEIEAFGLDKVYSAWESEIPIQVFKTGSTSGCTQGMLARPIHTKSATCKKESKLKDSNGEIRILQQQIIIHGNQFGAKGDSGSAVLRYNDDGVSELVGIFTGSINDSLYLCSPAEILTENSFKFAILED